MSPDPFTNYLMQDRPRWYCLQSQATGKLILEDMDENGDPVGSVLVYWDRADAEGAAIAHRETYPSLLIEVVPLPACPPAVVRPKPRENAEVVSAQASISLADQCVQVEVRPRTGSSCTRLMQLIGNALKIVAESEPMARMSPVVFFRLGPLTKQADSIDKVA